MCLWSVKSKLKLYKIENEQDPWSVKWTRSLFMFSRYYKGDLLCQCLRTMTVLYVCVLIFPKAYAMIPNTMYVLMTSLCETRPCSVTEELVPLAMLVHTPFSVFTHHFSQPLYTIERTFHTFTMTIFRRTYRVPIHTAPISWFPWHV
jgi:hypothetical protein